MISNCETTRILSFGCSTGEEVNSLREIFSKPIIYGTDINKYCIQKARKKFNHSKNIFIHSLSITFDKLTDLDVIFCMAVFQHPVNRHDLSLKESKYPFAKFNEEISRLDQKLKKGGLFIIDHADFNFMETSVSKHYKPLEVKENRIIRNRPAFNRENIKVSSQTNFYRIFKKID
ncbi:MAG: methyltransferase domain-containing protein [Bacteroidota bacterium]|nr:methyltransferase domain-containing protein [Bacteroidota bacterium]